MLYCPKCSRTYEKGTRRFCDTDGSRLLPAEPEAHPKNVFASILGKTLTGRETIGKPAAPAETAFKPLEIENIFKSENDSAIAAKVEENSSKPIARLIKPFEIPVSQAKLGNRTQNPPGRAALSWENPDVLVGQTVKGRYLITEKLSEDETSIAYLAEDRIGGGKKVVVRVLMDEDVTNAASKTLAEERVALSHINHPNVAHLLDSGELPEGIPFIITEFVAGVSLREKLETGGQFDAQRAARIVRQAADALNEVHQNGILHRNLKPENIILSVSEAGIEQVKVTDFGVFDGLEEQGAEQLAYLAPEQIAGDAPDFTGDVYSLAAIAYRMLTGRPPFDFSTESELLKAQKNGFITQPTDVRQDISPAADEILQKALSYDTAERYPKARDFGDAFYNALTNAELQKKPADDTEILPEEEKILRQAKLSSISEIVEQNSLIDVESLPETEISIERETDAEKINAEKINREEATAKNGAIGETVGINENPVRQKHSPASNNPVNTWRAGSVILGILILCAIGWGALNYFQNRPAQTVNVPPPLNNQPAIAEKPVNSAAENPNNVAEKSLPSIESKTPDAPRVVQPPDTVYFQNSRENLKGDLLKNFRGFSFYYPKDWAKNASLTNFADVARVGATGTPIEQMIVGYYESKGDFAADEKNFARLVQESNKSLAKEIPDYQLISQGETQLNGESKAFEMKFQGSGVTKNGDKITLWGRRLWIPAARDGAKTGLKVTMLATSNSPEVKSADDVGVKGELASVLQTFEPDSLVATPH